jgi:S1-C subfamily serine protease
MDEMFLFHETRREEVVMHDLQEQSSVIQPGPAAQRPATGFMLPKPPAPRLRTGAMIALTLLLALVFGIGLFAGWVYGTRSPGTASLAPGSSPTAPVPPVTGSGSSLDAVREAVIAKIRPAVVQVNVTTASGSGLGSGVIIDERGYIITNHHVIAGAQLIQVTLYDGASLRAQLVGTDPLDDLAVVKVSAPAKLIVAPLGDSSKLQVGQEVLAVGNPLGITQTVTSGIISALDRTVSTIPDAIQTDAAINPGNSGGALVDLQGELVGIPTFAAIDPQFQTPANGVGFAIPSNRVRFISQQLIENGRVIHTGRAAMGIQMTTVDTVLAAQYNLLVTAGVLIVKVTPNSPAAVAGLNPDDIIVQMDKKAVVDVASFADALLTMNPGEVVAVHVFRGNQPLTINVTLGEAQAS